MAAESDAELAQTVRREAAPLVMSLHRRLGNLDVAEEAVADAIVEALRTWRRNGVPDRPGAWLHTAAYRNAIDRLRSQSRGEQAAQRLAEQNRQTADEPDDRVTLLFTACHPALAPEARLALTLRAVVGLTTAEIGRAFLTSEATVAQRIVRAKRKIAAAGIALHIPEDAGQRTDRLDSVLTVIALVYNESHLRTSGETASSRRLARDALWLATVVATSFPTEAEALGLLALLTLQHAREPARMADGRLVLLPDQDRTRWDGVAVAEGLALLERAAELRAPGRFQLQAAIAACHAQAPTWADTDWPQILTLYDVLLLHDPSPVVRLNRAVALSHVAGAEPALREVEQLLTALPDYHLVHATHAALLRQLGRGEEGQAADAKALSLVRNAAERDLLAGRLQS